jgi:hypothetical protein
VTEPLAFFIRFGSMTFAPAVWSGAFWPPPPPPPPLSLPPQPTTPAMSAALPNSSATYRFLRIEIPLLVGLPDLTGLPLYP